MVRERALQEFKESLMSRFSAKEISDITSLFLMTMDKYEISERTTEVGFVDNSNEIILKNYAGSLLVEGKARKTVEAYIRVMKKFSEDRNKNLTDMTPNDIRVWLATSQQTCSLRTCETYRSYLSAFYQWMYEEKWVEQNPMVRIKPIKFEKKVKKAFSSAEVDLLKSSCVTLQERAMIELLLSSGIRVSEFVALDKEDINFTDLTVFVKEGKGNKQRQTFMSEVCAVHLSKYLASRRDSDTALFVSNCRTRISCRSVERKLATLGERAEINNVHPHRFRRHFATTLYNNGMDLRAIQLLMGHADINVTMQYIASNTESIKNAYKKCI